MKDRLDTLLGTTRWQSALAEGLNLHRVTVAKWFTNDVNNPPEWLEAIIEFLEITPAKKWPPRWKRLYDLKTAAKSKQSS